MSSSAERVERRLAAIFAADVAGYSRLMSQDEVGTLRALAAHREIMDHFIAEHGGRIANTAGDSVLAEFPSLVDAVQCAVAVQERLAEANAGVAEDRVLRSRIGVHVGDVMVRGGDLLGDGVNIAARLEQRAEPGGVCISGRVYEEVEGKLAVSFEDRGEQQVKNIARPIRVYALAGTAPRHSEPKLLSIADRPSIAVLPFINLSADPEQDFFSEGISEDIITELSRIGELFVIARNSSFAYKGRAVDIQKVGRELGAYYIVEGSVRRMGDRVRITAQLIEVPTGAHIWADRYDRVLADIFDVQDEVIRSIVASTQTQVVMNEGTRAERAARPELQTWELAKRGWKQLYIATEDGLREGREIGRRIVEIDPTSAKGHQLIAVADFHLVYMAFATDPEELKNEALREAREAVRLDTHDEYSHWALGMVLGTLFGRLDDSIPAYRQALDINPNFFLAYGSLGTTLAFAGRVSESIDNTMVCMRLNPRDPSIFFRYSSLSLAYFLRKSFEEAREWADRAVAKKPDWWFGHALLAASRERTGDHAAATTAVSRLMALFPNLTLTTFPLDIRDQDGKELLRSSLRAAGFPESSCHLPPFRCEPT